MIEILVVVGARPNFMKAASLVRAAEESGTTCALVHTGQHYDPELSEVFFRDLELPEPHVTLGIGSGSHAAQTGRIMLAFESELHRLDPEVVVVVGDVNSTLACALVAAKEHYPVAHVEAGLRSFDDRMPEELNRRVVDHLSRYLFTTSLDANENLEREGIPRSRVSLVGNTMVDTLLRCVDAARSRRMPRRLGLDGDYAVATLHRPENVDNPDKLAALAGALAEVSRLLPVVLPLHPRTRARLTASGLHERLGGDGGIRITPPLGYLDFLGLVVDARLVLTDSGGIQEETTALRVPCLTLRDSTERPVTVTSGSNRVVGHDPRPIVNAAREALAVRARAETLPPLWDGRAGERIIARLQSSLVGLAEVPSVAY